MYKKVWGYKRKLYVSLDAGAWADEDVETLHKSLRGLGTDEANLIRILANRSSAQMVEINKRFVTKFGARGDLIKWIEDDTTGDIRNVLTSIAKDEADSDADALHKAMKGLGTDEQVMMSILADRTPFELERVRDAFDRKYNGKGGLNKWIEDDTSGDLKQVLLLLADRSVMYATLVNRAIEKRDALETLRLLQPLRRNDRLRAVLETQTDPLNMAQDLMEEIEDELITPSTKQLFATYNQKFGKSIPDAINAAFGAGPVTDMLQAQIDDQATRDAVEIHKAMKGMGTNEIKLIEMLAGRSPREREELDAAYRRIHTKSLSEAIASETSFKFKQSLTRLSRSKAESLAHALKDAMRGGMTTSDDRLIIMLTHRSKREIREAAEAYKTLFNKTLLEELRSSTSGWYRKTLTYIVREAFQLRVHVAKQWLHLQRDVDV